MNVRFSLAAQRDVQGIVAFLRPHGTLASKFYDDLQAAVDHLTVWPHTAIRRDELTGNSKLRLWLMSPYYIILLPQADSLEILAVLHTSQQIRRELRHRTR